MTEFPSKRLPDGLHELYAGSAQRKPQGRIDAAAQTLEQQVIQPLALRAADQSSSHLNAVKIHKFSTHASTTKPRTTRKPTANNLAKTFSPSFFQPLLTKYQLDITSYGSASIYHGTTAPTVLSTLIKTLSILLHASGPATVNLPDLLNTFWDFLLTLRVPAANDLAILQAVLLALLTMLEVCAAADQHRRIVAECPRLVVETREWVQVVFERTREGGWVVGRGGKGEGVDEEEKVRRLAAGVLMRCEEIGEVFRGQLNGGRG